jgi:triacylglycerol esterase/lipase EstA (alpha/beta hydrolase family)
MEQSRRAEKIITNYCVPAALKTGKQLRNDLIGHSFFGCVTTRPFVHLYVSHVAAVARCSTPDLNTELRGFVSEKLPYFTVHSLIWYNALINS